MGVDGVESETTHVSVENGKKESSPNGHISKNESANHGNESVQVEAAAAISFPKDAVEEKSIYFVKYRMVEDQNVKKNDQVHLASNKDDDEKKEKSINMVGKSESASPTTPSASGIFSFGGSTKNSNTTPATASLSSAPSTTLSASSAFTSEISAKIDKEPTSINISSSLHLAPYKMW